MDLAVTTKVLARGGFTNGGPRRATEGHAITRLRTPTDKATLPLSPPIPAARLLSFSVQREAGEVRLKKTRFHAGFRAAA